LILYILINRHFVSRSFFELRPLCWLVQEPQNQPVVHVRRRGRRPDARGGHSEVERWRRLAHRLRPVLQSEKTRGQVHQARLQAGGLWLGQLAANRRDDGSQEGLEAQSLFCFEPNLLFLYFQKRFFFVVIYKSRWERLAVYVLWKFEYIYKRFLFSLLLIYSKYIFVFPSTISTEVIHKILETFK